MAKHAGTARGASWEHGAMAQTTIMDAVAIIAELRAARECVEYLERILDTDAVRNENEELDGEASAVLSEWKKATKGDG